MKDTEKLLDALEFARAQLCLLADAARPIAPDIARGADGGAIYLADILRESRPGAAADDPMAVFTSRVGSALLNCHLAVRHIDRPLALLGAMAAGQAFKAKGVAGLDEWLSTIRATVLAVSLAETTPPEAGQ